MDNKKRVFVLCTTNSGSSFLARSFTNCANVVGFDDVYSSEACLLPLAHEYNVPRLQNRLNRYNTLNVITMKRVIEDSWKRSGKYSTGPQVLFSKSPGYDIFCAAEMEKFFYEPNFIILMRHPMAYVEGIKRRDNDCTMFKTKQALQYWLDCAYKQKENYEKLESAICITYESMCEAPLEVAEIIRDYMYPLIPDFSLLNSIKVDSIIGDEEKPITNLNSLQIKNMRQADISYIRSVLSQHKQLLDFFEYEVNI